MIFWHTCVNWSGVTKEKSVCFDFGRICFFFCLFALNFQELAAEVWNSEEVTWRSVSPIRGYKYLHDTKLGNTRVVDRYDTALSAWLYTEIISNIYCCKACKPLWNICSQKNRSTGSRLPTDNKLIKQSPHKIINKRPRNWRELEVTQLCVVMWPNFKCHRKVQYAEGEANNEMVALFLTN